MKLLAVIDPKNKYHNAIFFGNRRVSDGNNGLVSLRIDWAGKKAVLHMETTAFDLLVMSDRCPETDRREILDQVLGNRPELAKLNVRCEMLQMSSNACDGCPLRSKLE